MSITSEDSIREVLNYIDIHYRDMDADARLEMAVRLLEIVTHICLHKPDTFGRIFKEAEKRLNVHVLKARFYSPLPVLKELPESVWTKQWTTGIDWNEAKGLKLLNAISQYGNDYKALINSGRFDPLSKPYAFHDAALYFCMICHFKPKRIIEVGSGKSTKLARLASPDVEITAIEPFQNLDVENIRQIRQPVQEVPASTFQQLRKNDILFIDSTHVSKVGSDVNYLYLEILPLLNKGVLVHIHDIFLPDEMPKQWVNERAIFWNEQYLLHAFLISNNDYEVLFGVNYMKKYHPDALLNIYDNEPIGGGSFWIRKH